MKQGISLCSLAKRLDRAKSGLHKLAVSGQIPRHADGSYDEAAVRVALEANLDPGRRAPVRSPAGERSPKSVNTRKAKKPAAPPVKTPDDALEAVSLIARVLREEGHVDPGKLDYNAARTAETILKARERAISIAERQKTLVNLERVRRQVYDLGRQFRDVVQQIPARHAAQIAAAVGCNVHELDRELTRVIRETLSQIAEREIRA
jgi:hypothetical protein